MTVLAGLPPGKRGHRNARIDATGQKHLLTAMRRWAEGRHLPRQEFARVMFGAQPDGRGVRNFHDATLSLAEATRPQHLRDATDEFAAGMVDVGLDYFPRFLAAAALRAERDVPGLLLDVQSRRGLGGGPVRVPGGGWRDLTPGEQLRMERYGIAIERLRRLEPNSRLSESLIAPNAVPNEEFVRQVEREADAAFVRSQSPLIPPPGGTPSLGHIGPGGLFTFVGPDGSQDVFGNRNIPGVATTTAALPEVRGQWLTPNMPYGAPVPAQVASLLVGRRFQDFDALREAFWEAVAKVPELAAQFPHDDFVRMQDGSAPTAPTPGWAGKRAVYELHHHIPIRLGGAIYNLNNILVISPRSHIDIHR